jgi:hypothetical protein
VEGWRPVEDIVRWGFGQVPVVMANEFHSGLARCVRTRVIGTALDLGWTLWAYECRFDATPRRDPAHLLSMEFTNWRERQQAANLCRLLESAPGEPMLVWCGNSHASKHEPAGCGDDEWIPMGWNFRELSGIDPFVIDQTVTVNFCGRPPGHAHELLEFLADTLADLGGTAGILRAQAPPPLNERAGVDALVVSTDNELTGEEPTEDELTGDRA